MEDRSAKSVQQALNAQRKTSSHKSVFQASIAQPENKVVLNVRQASIAPILLKHQPYVHTGKHQKLVLLLALDAQMAQSVTLLEP